MKQKQACYKHGPEKIMQTYDQIEIIGGGGKNPSIEDLYCYTRDAQYFDLLVTALTSNLPSDPQTATTADPKISVHFFSTGQ